MAAAVRQGVPSTSGRPLENGNGAHASSTPHSQPAQRLPESAETALLYVRFRTVAEPGLKGVAAMGASAVACSAFETPSLPLLLLNNTQRQLLIILIRSHGLAGPRNPMRGSVQSRQHGGPSAGEKDGEGGGDGWMVSVSRSLDANCCSTFAVIHRASGELAM